MFPTLNEPVFLCKYQFIKEVYKNNYNYNLLKIRDLLAPAGELGKEDNRTGCKIKGDSP